ncbi:type II secretion system F family protein [Arthrobacter halodurans]|uniref:Type II secretion system F family protein n=1 Tax=Arthrobacter halodurans TaxID=516699 RepID=A0ABV4UK98_9MICC
MDLLIPAAGIAACLGACLLTLFVVLRPASAEVPLSRRRVHRDHATEASALTRLSGVTVQAMERRVGAAGSGPFNRQMLELAGVKMAPAELLVVVAAGMLIAGLAGLVIGGPGMGLLLATLVPFAAWLTLRLKVDKRRARFADQLPDLIMTLTGSLRAGHSVMRAIDGAAQEFDAPLSEELSRIVNESRVGRDPDQTMLESAHRMRSEDFSWVADAIRINREVGGDLSQVLDQVGDTIRERSQIKGQIRALAAEGKFSAYILVGLPFAITAIMFVMNPSYIGSLFTETLGILMLVVGGISMAIGTLWMSRIIQIKF